MDECLSQLNALIRRQNAFYHRCAKACGLSDAQFWILHALSETEGGLCQNAFCERWHYSKQTVCAAVSGLVRSGLVTLSYAVASRKLKKLQLTEAGARLCQRQVAGVRAMEERGLARLTEQERKDFLGVYERLMTELERESGLVPDV